MDMLPAAKINSISVFENNIEDVLNHVANGGSLTQYCKLVKCDYSALMKKIRANEEIHNRFKQAIEDRKEWSKERILEELKYMGSYNIQDAVNPDGRLKKIRDLPEDLARSIKEVDADGGIKFTDKLAALRDKQKLLGLNVEQVELSGTVTLESLILQARSLKNDT